MVFDFLQRYNKELIITTLYRILSRLRRSVRGNLPYLRAYTRSWG